MKFKIYLCLKSSPESTLIDVFPGGFQVEMRRRIKAHEEKDVAGSSGEK